MTAPNESVAERRAYPIDLTAAQWRAVAEAMARRRQIIEPLLLPPKSGGRPRMTNLGEVVNAVFYLSRSGCSWRMLPHEFPPWGTVHYYARCWRLDGTWERVMNVLRAQAPSCGGHNGPGHGRSGPWR